METTPTRVEYTRTFVSASCLEFEEGNGVLFAFRTFHRARLWFCDKFLRRIQDSFLNLSGIHFVDRHVIGSTDGIEM